MSTEKIYTLKDILVGESCLVVKINGYGEFRHRIENLGFIKGERISVIRNAPMQGAIEYQVMNSHVTLRQSEAAQILVEREGGEANLRLPYIGTMESNLSKKSINALSSNEISVVLIGNPNSGKTSLFNAMTGLHEKVGNYGGVTVDEKSASFIYKGYKIKLIDLPGVYSLSNYSREETMIRDLIIDSKPDVLLNVIDSSNIKRSLFLTTQLIDLDMRMVVALNMFDEMQKHGLSLNLQSLSAMLGFPIVPTIASKERKGLDILFEEIINVYEEKNNLLRHIHINYGREIEKAINDLEFLLEGNTDVKDIYHTRYIALMLIQNDSNICDKIRLTNNGENVLARAELQRNVLMAEFGDDISNVITNMRYGFISGALLETLTTNKDSNVAFSSGRKIDSILMNRWFGIPILLFFLWFMFQGTFMLGAYPQQWIEKAIIFTNNLINDIIPSGVLNSMLTDGIISGMGSVLSFLPQIVILFFFISLLEDTGYLARASFIMDKFMHKMGLHGRSFIPYLISFGCNVPAILTTRNLSTRERIITIFTIPFISCSARLPIYLLLVAAFFPKNQGLVLLSIYLIGLIIAILTAKVLRHIHFADQESPLVMELPPYRMPSLKSVFFHMWEMAHEYVKKVSTLILVSSIIIWAISYFPNNSPQELAIDEKIELINEDSNISSLERDSILNKLNLEKSYIQTENSYMGQIGRFISPVMEPLGYDATMGVSLLSGICAKEVIVSTMGVLYNADISADENSTPLIQGLRTQTWSSGPNIGKPVFTPLVAFSFLIFTLLYFPCIATIAVIAREAGRKWALLSMTYNTLLAWILCFLIYQIGKLF